MRWWHQCRSCKISPMQAVKEWRLVILMLNGIVKIEPVQCKRIEGTEAKVVINRRIRSRAMNSKAEKARINQVVSKQDVVLRVVALGRYGVVRCESGDAPQFGSSPETPTCTVHAIRTVVLV